MAARIPQMYQPKKHASPPSPESPTSGLGLNPFAGSTDSLAAPSSPVVRDSVNLSSIGGLLMRNSGAWSTMDDDDIEPPAVVRTGNRARSSTIISTDERFGQVDRAALHARVRDLEDDDFDNHDPLMSDDDSDYDHDRDSRPINAGAIGGLGLGALSTGPTQALQPRARTPSPATAPVQGQSQPQPQSQPTVRRAPVQGPASPTHHYHHQQQQQQHVKGHPERPSVVVNFPTPNIAPSAAPSWSPPTPVTPSRPDPNVAFSNGKQRPERPRVQLPVFSNAQPVSPMLAAPPKAHFSSPNSMTPPSSPSLRGFDSMKEKAATFREDETEVMNPFSPNARQAGPRGHGRSNLNPNGRKSGVRPYTTVDFWKRFSTMGRVNDGSKESGWMAERKRSIWSKPLFVVPLILTLIAAGAIITYVVIRVQHSKSVTDTS